IPGVEGNANRETSGRGGSILITSAPRSIRVRAQSGPARTREKSTTRMPQRGPLWGPLISAPRKLGETGAVLAKRFEPDLQIFGSPDRLLDLGHCLIRREHPLIDRDVYETFRRRMRHRRPMRQFLGDRERRLIERVIGNEADVLDDIAVSRAITGADAVF